MKRDRVVRENIIEFQLHKKRKSGEELTRK